MKSVSVIQSQWFKATQSRSYQSHFYDAFIIWEVMPQIFQPDTQKQKARKDQLKHEVRSLAQESKLCNGLKIHTIIHSALGKIPAIWTICTKAAHNKLIFVILNSFATKEKYTRGRLEKKKRQRRRKKNLPVPWIPVMLWYFSVEIFSD